MEGTNTLFFSHKISLGTRKDFFEIHRQFGHASSKRFGSSGLGYEMDGRETLIRFSALSRNFCLFQSVKSCGGCWSSYTLSYWGTATTAAWEWSSVLRIRVFGAVPPLPLRLHGLLLSSVWCLVLILKSTIWLTLRRLMSYIYIWGTYSWCF